MKRHQTLILSFISSAIVTAASANTLDNRLSGIDATQQQRQQQHQQHQAEKLQSQADVRLDISANDTTPFQSRISLLPHSSNQSS